MTRQMPDDMFLENSTVTQQLPEGNLNPQPGMIMDGDLDPGRRRVRLNRTVVALIILISVLPIFFDRMRFIYSR